MHRLQNVKSAAAALIGKAIAVPDRVATRSWKSPRRGLLAVSEGAFSHGHPWSARERDPSASAIEARLRTVIASALAWIVPEREAHVYRSTAPYHFDRVFRTWQ